MDKQKLLSIGAFVLVVLALGGYMIFGKKKTSEPVVTVSPTVATVNGVNITEDQFNSQLATSIAALKAQNQDVTSPDKLSQIRTQVLNDLVNNELVNQGIVQAGITVAPADVDAQYSALVTQVGGADKMLAQLAQASTTEAAVRANIAKQLAVQAYLVKNVDVSKVTVTDAEIAKFYKDNTTGQTNVPALKDVSAQIKQQLLANKQQELVLAFISTLRAKAQVQTSLK